MKMIEYDLTTGSTTYLSKLSPTQQKLLANADDFCAIQVSIPGGITFREGRDGAGSTFMFLDYHVKSESAVTLWQNNKLQSSKEWSCSGPGFNEVYINGEEWCFTYMHHCFI